MTTLPQTTGLGTPTTKAGASAGVTRGGAEADSADARSWWAQRRARWKKMMRPPRRITFTRAGKFFMLLTLAVGLGALNTGNNLLFLLLGMMLSATIASGILSEGVLRKLRVERSVPRRVFARQPAMGLFRITNPRGYLSLNIEVCEESATCVEGPRAGERFGPRDIPFWKFWVSDNFDEVDAHVALGRVAHLEPDTRTDVATRYQLPVRGRFEIEGMRLTTRFPFGLFHKIVEVPVPLALTVFPEPAPSGDWLADVAARFGDIARNRSGLGEEYFGLRDWREGEDRRRIHWRSSARRGSPVVREFEEQEQRAVELVVVNAWSGDGPWPASAQLRFERGLSKTVGLLGDLTRGHYRVGLCTLDARVGVRQGEAHLDTMLNQLATVTLHDARDAGESFQWGSLKAPTGSAGLRQSELARVGIGFRDALLSCGQSFDLILALDELKERELALQPARLSEMTPATKGGA